MRGVKQEASVEIVTHGLFIDGQETAAATTSTLDVLNPANGRVIARIAHAQSADVGRAVASARRFDMAAVSAAPYMFPTQSGRPRFCCAIPS
jgi:hypothetical protein